jgi:ATP-binding cassette subfamily F protein 3
MVAGVAAPDEGTRLVADGVRVGYFAQDQFEVLQPERTLHQHMLEVADTRTTPAVRPILGAFLFGEDDLDKKVVTLSGGEKARLLLARMLLQPFGLLVMDEPTNHLDIASREVLETALREHQGTIVFTSHDRRFMDTLATSVLELRDGRMTRYPGNYSYYVSKVGDPFATAARSSGESRSDARSGTAQRDLERDRKRDEAERRNRMYRILKPLRDRVAAGEVTIASLEAELKDLDEALVQPDLYQDPVRARELGRQARDVRARLEAAYEEWSDAAEELARVEQEQEPVEPPRE